MTQPPGSQWLDYLAAPFSGYPGRMYLARKSGRASQKDEAIFVDRISSQFFRISNYLMLNEKIPERDVLVKRGVIIPSRKEDPGFNARDRLEGWIAFLETQPKLEKTYRSACSSAVVDYLLDKSWGKSGNLLYVRQQLERLRPDWRKRVVLGILHTGTVKIIARLFAGPCRAWGR